MYISHCSLHRQSRIDWVEILHPVMNVEMWIVCRSKNMSWPSASPLGHRRSHADYKRLSHSFTTVEGILQARAHHGKLTWLPAKEVIQQVVGGPSTKISLPSWITDAMKPVPIFFYSAHNHIMLNKMDWVEWWLGAGHHWAQTVMMASDDFCRPKDTKNIWAPAAIHLYELWDVT